MEILINLGSLISSQQHTLIYITNQYVSMLMMYKNKTL